MAVTRSISSLPLPRPDLRLPSVTRSQGPVPPRRVRVLAAKLRRSPGAVRAAISAPLPRRHGRPEAEQRFANASRWPLSSTLTGSSSHGRPSSAAVGGCDQDRLLPCRLQHAEIDHQRRRCAGHELAHARRVVGEAGTAPPPAARSPTAPAPPGWSAHGPAGAARGPGAAWPRPRAPASTVKGWVAIARVPPSIGRGEGTAVAGVAAGPQFPSPV